MEILPLIGGIHFTQHVVVLVYMYCYFQVSVPDIVPIEFRPCDMVLDNPDQIKEFHHPISGKRRYVVGDRFHTKTDPHKSPLCAYHDIELCEQATSLKTSYQESENHRKNFLRLRSSTMQSFSVHFFYNYLMDYYNNEQIVQRQIRDLEKSLNKGQEIVRDIYCRFNIQSKQT